MTTTDQFTDLMIDLETLGTTPGSVVTQIGLCSFNALGDKSMEASQIHVDVQSSLNAGMTMDWETIRWWLMQEQEAREAMTIGGVELTDAVDQMNDHVRKYHDVGAAEFRVWGYASTFDPVLLSSLARAAGAELLWGYRQESCLRTLARLYPEVERPEPMTKHIASYDALAQAKWCQGIFARMEADRAAAANYKEMKN